MYSLALTRNIWILHDYMWSCLVICVIRLSKLTVFLLGEKCKLLDHSGNLESCRKWPLYFPH